MDALGNISSDNISSSVIFDNITPDDASGILILTGTGVSTSDNQTFYINQSRSLGFDNSSGPLATDNTSNGGTGTTLIYHVRDNNTAPGSSDTFKALSAWSMTKSDNTSFYVWAKDNASNINTTVLDNLSLVLDNTSPIISAVTVYHAVDNSTDNVTNSATSRITSDNNTLMVDLRATDTISDVAKYYWSVDNTTAPTTSSTWNDNLTSSSNTISDNLTWLVFDNSTGNKTMTIRVWVMDNASNISSVGSDNISYYYYP
jgi:hypothetical protein